MKHFNYHYSIVILHDVLGIEIASSSDMIGTADILLKDLRFCLGKIESTNKILSIISCLISWYLINHSLLTSLVTALDWNSVSLGIQSINTFYPGWICELSLLIKFYQYSIEHIMLGHISTLKISILLWERNSQTYWEVVSNN